MRQGEEESRYFKIGLFVLIGIAILIMLMLVFGGGHLFSKTVYVETYFNESVQGLTVGSPVKYRGITIGKVKKITFVANIYKNSSRKGHYGRYIYVLFSINSDFIHDIKESQLSKLIRKEVIFGLRAKLALQDLTGNAYLELNFTNPKQNPVLPLTWKPDHIYIPSTTSVLTRFTDNVQAILNGLKDVNFKQFFNNIQDLAKTTNDTMQSVDNILRRSQVSIISSAHNIQSATNNLSSLTGQLKENPSSILFNKPAEINPADL